MRFEYRINSFLSFILGAFLNVYLLYIIRQKSNKILQLYKLILEQNCILNLLFLIISFIVQPVIINF